MWRTNLEGSCAVLRAVALAGVPHLVAASFVAAYPPRAPSGPRRRGLAARRDPGQRLQPAEGGAGELARRLRGDPPGRGGGADPAVRGPERGGRRGAGELDPQPPGTA